MKIPSFNLSSIARLTALLVTTSMFSLFAQTPPAKTDTATAAEDYDFKAPVGPHHRVVDAMVDKVDAQGNTVQVPTHYTEIATGLNYQDAQGQWQVSEEKIEPHPEGAAALKGYYKVIFKRNLNQSGAIKLITPGGSEVKNHPLGLYYVDRSNGQWVKLSGIQDSVGELVGDNQVIYRNVGDSLKIDLHYTFQRGQFHADWILRERPPPPSDFGLSADTALEALTEFVDAPEPQQSSQVVRAEPDATKRQTMSEPDVTDVGLDFGALQMITGQAFPLSKGVADSALPVAKQWLEVGSRRLLSERVESKDLDTMLATLPLNKGADLTLAKGARVWPDAPIAVGQDSPMQQSKISDGSPGVVLDYTTIPTLTTNNYSFTAGTYYLTNTLTINNGNCAFSSGAYLKFGTNGQIQVTSTCQLSGSGATLTCWTDDSVGETITGSSGTPATVNGPGIYAQGEYPNLNHGASSLTFKWLGTAFRATGNTSTPVGNITLSSCTFLNCGTAVQKDGNANPSLNIVNPIFCGNSLNYNPSGITHSGDNNCPTISDIANQTINEDWYTGNLPFTIWDAETSASSLSVSGASSDWNIVPPGNITFGGSGANRTVFVTPAANQSGTVTITVTVTDAGGLTASDSFLLTVNPVNDAPTIAVIPNQYVRAGKVRFVPVTIGDIDTSVGSLSVTPSWGSSPLLTGYTPYGSGSLRLIRLAISPDSTGTVPVTVTVSDGQLSAQTTFNVTILPVFRDPDGYNYPYYLPGDVPQSASSLNPTRPPGGGGSAGGPSGGGGGGGGGSGNAPDISGFQKLQVNVGGTCWDDTFGLSDQDKFDITIDQEDTYILPPDDGRDFYINAQITAMVDDWSKSSATLAGFTTVQAPPTGPDCGMQQLSSWGYGFQKISYCSKYSLGYTATLASNGGVSGGSAWVSAVYLVPGDDDGGGCSQCGSIGNLNGAAGSVALQLDLSKNEFGRWGHKMFMHEFMPMPELATPKCLSSSVTAGVDSDLVKAVDGSIRQIKVPKGLVDVLTVSQYKYNLNFYDTTMLGNGGAKLNGLYVTNANATPMCTFEFSNPNLNTNNCNTLNVIENRGGLLVNNQYVYTPAGGGNPAKWEFMQANSLRKERNECATNGITRTETLTVLKPTTSAAVRKHQTTYLTLGAGDVVIDKTYDPDVQNIKATYVYWTNVTDYGYGKLRQENLPNGEWKTLEYDSQGRILRICSSFTNQVVTTDTNLCRAAVFDYTPITAAGDTGTYRPQLPRTEINYVLGKEIGRKYYVYKQGEKQDIVCTVANVLWNDSANLVTITKRVTSGFFQDELLSVKRPDGTMTFYSYSTNSTGKTTITTDGAPNAGLTAIVDGTLTTNVVGTMGQPFLHSTTDIASGKVLSSETYTNFDAIGRAQKVTYLDGTTETMTYGCCGQDSKTDRDGVTTTYAYDDLKRLTSETRLGITTSFTYDEAGHVLTVTRQGTSGPAIVVKQSAYDLAGRLTSETNAVGVVTTYSEAPDGTGQTIRTTTYAAGTADAATKIETYARDGTLLKVIGTGVTNLVRFEFSVEQDAGVWRVSKKEIKLDASGNDTSELTKVFIDTAGREYKKVFADANYEQMFFNNQGQMWKQRDADSVVKLFAYDAKGQLNMTAIDVDKTDTIVQNSKDRITQRLDDVVAAHSTNCRRVRTFEWNTDNNTNAVQTTMTETSVDGLQTWTTSFGLVKKVQTVFLTGGNRTVTTTNPDNSYLVHSYLNGRLISATRYDSAGGQLGSISVTYDAHGRKATETDARNGTTTFTYDNADRMTSVTTPPPGTGQNAQTTTSYFDNRGRVWRTDFPDGTSKTNEFFPTGLRKKTYGSRDYPIEYTYDGLGRVKTMKTWTNFASGTGAAITTWNYHTQRGFLLNKRYPDNTGPDYTYTASGKLKTRDWARTGTGGQRIRTTYQYGFEDAITDNDHGDLVNVTYTNDPQNTPSMTYTYDRRGRQVTSVCNGITTTAAYDDSGPLLSESYASGTLGGLSVQFTLDAQLRKSTVAAKNGASVLGNTTTLGYDNASRVSSVINGTYSANYTRLANSELLDTVTFKQSTTTRMTTTRQYDKLNRLLNITSNPGGTSSSASMVFAYQYNDANQRTSATLVDGSYWLYQYDLLGQVVAAKRFWGDGTPVAGQQFEYAFDDIGNRTSTKAGGDSSGANLRAASYTANNLNQYSSRTVPTGFDVIGLANNASSVTVNGSAADYRRGEYFQKVVNVSNGSAAVWQNVSVATSGGGSASGNVFVAKTPENYSYDLDGNTTQDGQWVNTFDGENRLIRQVSATAVGPQQRLDFEYDCKGRRIRKKVWNNTSGTGSPAVDLKFLYDGWNLLAVLDSGNALVKSFVWGLDLSGSLQGAGGVGGLIAITPAGGSSHFAGYDGNGNVTVLVDGSSGNVSAIYEFAPFGELIRMTGAQALANPFRFSTKYQDDETGFLYYGYRFYNPITGRWLSRDPIGEISRQTLMARTTSRNRLDLGNLYNFVYNNSFARIDPDGRNPIAAGGIAVAAGLGLGYCINYGCCIFHRNTLFAFGEGEANRNAPDGSTHRGPNAVEGGDADALTHCITACNMAKDPKCCGGLDRALDWLQEREVGNAIGTQLDRMNNENGFAIGMDKPTDCTQACLNALGRGLLNEIENGRIVPSSVQEGQ